jgi:putative transposase
MRVNSSHSLTLHQGMSQWRMCRCERLASRLECTRTPCVSGQMTDGSTASEQKEASGALTSMVTSAVAVLRSLVTAGCPAPGSETTSSDKSPTCAQSGPTRKSLKTSDRASTSKGKVCVRYWSEQCAERSSRLWSPTVTDWHASDSTSSPSSLVSPAARSWFSTKFLSAPRRSSKPIFAPSFKSFRAASTDGANTRARRIRLYPMAPQKALSKPWFGVSRPAFNKTVETLRQPGQKANWKAITGKILANRPGFCKEVPGPIINIAIKDACPAVSAAKRTFTETGEIREVGLRSRKAPSQSAFIPGSAISNAGIDPTISGGGLVLTQPLPEMRDGKTSNQRREEIRLAAKAIAERVCKAAKPIVLEDVAAGFGRSSGDFGMLVLRNCSF